MGCDTGQQVSQQSVESTPASTSSEHAAVEFTSAAFEADVLNNSKIVLVDCWAPWWPPCVQLGPTIDKLASEYDGKAVIGKLNVDDASEVAQQYNVTGIPALLFFRDGKEVDRLVGGQSEAAIAAKLDELIGG